MGPGMTSSLWGAWWKDILRVVLEEEQSGMLDYRGSTKYPESGVASAG